MNELQKIFNEKITGTKFIDINFKKNKINIELEFLTNVRIEDLMEFCNKYKMIFYIYQILGKMYCVIHEHPEYEFEIKD